MKKISVVLAALLVAVITSCSGKPDANGWYSDFDSAAKACGKNKSVILFITSDYDMPGSEPGVKAILSKEFTDALKDTYTFAHFDFTGINPQAELSAAEQKALEKQLARTKKQRLMADRLSVRATPAMYILSKEGYFISDVTYEYSADTPAGYAGFVKLENKTAEEFNALVQKANNGTKSEKIAAIKQIFENTPEAYSPAIVPLARKFVALDKNNESGSLSDMLFLITNGDSYEKLLNFDFEGAAKLYEKAATDSRFTPAHKNSLYYLAASAYSRVPSVSDERVLDLLKKAVEADPENPTVQKIQEIITAYEQNAALESEKASE